MSTNARKIAQRLAGRLVDATVLEGPERLWVTHPRKRGVRAVVVVTDEEAHEVTVSLQTTSGVEVGTVRLAGLSDDTIAAVVIAVIRNAEGGE